MKVCVLSTDSRVKQVFREAVAAVAEAAWDFMVCRHDQPLPDSDVYVWDYEAGRDDQTLPTMVDMGRFIFLIRREHLDALARLLGRRPLWVILKPVQAVTLRSFIEQAGRMRESTRTLACLREQRDRILDCLLEANLELQEFDRQRTNFLSRAVHDFRAPLTALSGYCGLLLSRQLGPLSNPQIDVLRRMQHSIKRLTRIAQATLELSTGRLAAQEPKWRPVDIQACVEQALHEILPLAEEKNLAVTVHVEPAGRPLVGDPFQIEQVLLNLLDNACKFTPKNGAIEVRGFPWFWERRNGRIRQAAGSGERRVSRSPAPNCYRIEIRDTGPGVSEQILDAMFRQYSPYAGTRDRSGGGLGLAICKMIVEAHRGEIFASNSAEGFTFAFVLPFASEGAPASPPPAHCQRLHAAQAECRGG